MSKRKRPVDTADYSTWLGHPVVAPEPDFNPNYFRGVYENGTCVTEDGYEKGEFWVARIQVDGFDITGSDFNRGTARAEAEAKFKELIAPLLAKLRRLGLLEEVPPAGS